ncbi:hypothetical protein [Virgibacillus sp. DJP39]
MKKMVKVIMVSTLIFGSYLFLEQSNVSNVYVSPDTLNGEDHPEY